MAKNDFTRPTVDYLRECFHLDERTGVLKWLCRPDEHFDTSLSAARWNGRFAGAVAGFAGSHGYWTICLDAKKIGAHRVVHAMATGAWAPNDVDHVNCNRRDNRPENLRAASRSENNANSVTLRKTNTSGYRGVSWFKPVGKWAAEISFRGRRFHLGYFDSAERASVAYQARAAELFGDFAHTPPASEV